MLYAAILMVLLLLEVFYFKIAAFFNIVDQPNLRSSHEVVTLRGGGIIFPLAVLIYLAVFGFSYGYFVLGLLMIAIVSFADDIKPQPKRIRAGVQNIALALLMYQVWDSNELLLLLPALIVLFGLLNAYNFMDGINGMTPLYSFTLLGSLFFLNNKLKVFDPQLLFCVALANAVFAWYNCRKHPRCFAGDVGSISMAFILLFFTAACIYLTSNPIFILLYALYIVDVGVTFLQRVIQRENVFEAHRKHLFQYLVNEKKYPHLAISGLYMLLQAMIDVGVFLIWQKDAYVQSLYTGSVLLILVICYFFIKRDGLRKIESVSRKIDVAG